MRAIKRRLRRVVGAAIGVLVISGLAMAQLRGLLRHDVDADPRVVLFHWKLVAAAILILTFLSALPLLRLVKRGSIRGRLFIGVHVMVLIVGALRRWLGWRCRAEAARARSSEREAEGQRRHVPAEVHVRGLIRLSGRP